MNASKNETERGTSEKKRLETGLSEKKRLETGMSEKRNAKGSGKLPGINAQKKRCLWREIRQTNFPGGSNYNM